MTTYHVPLYAPRMDYDAIAYKDDTKFIAKNRKGVEIDSGTEGAVVNAKVINAAIEYVPLHGRICIYGSVDIGDELIIDDKNISFDADSLTAVGMSSDQSMLKFVSSADDIQKNGHADIRVKHLDCANLCNGIKIIDGFANNIKNSRILNAKSGIILSDDVVFSEFTSIENSQFFLCDRGITFETHGSYVSFVHTNINHCGFNIGANQKGIDIIAASDFSNSIVSDCRFWTTDQTSIGIECRGLSRFAKFRDIVVENFARNGASCGLYFNCSGEPIIQNYSGGAVYEYGVVETILSPVIFSHHQITGNWSCTITTDGEFILEKAPSLNGIYLLEVSGTNRNHKILFTIQTNIYEYAGDASLKILSESAYMTHKVVTHIGIRSVSASLRCWTVTISDRNSAPVIVNVTKIVPTPYSGSFQGIPIVAEQLVSSETSILDQVTGKVVNSGSETGTGSEQTIPHGLAITPTPQQVILIAGSAMANPYHSKAPDATNIYVVAGSGQPWYWNVPWISI